MKTIQCTKGNVAFIDDGDFELVSKCKWSGNRYPQTTIDKKKVMMHHLIIGKPPQGMVTDHEDRNKFNNQRYNIKHVTRNHNNRNVAKRTSAPYRGICKLGRKWKSSITVDGVVKHLGTFCDPREAALAYDRAARLHHGESAHLNFPETLFEKKAA